MKKPLRYSIAAPQDDFGGPIFFPGRFAHALFRALETLRIGTQRLPRRAASSCWFIFSRLGDIGIYKRVLRFDCRLGFAPLVFCLRDVAAGSLKSKLAPVAVSHQSPAGA